MGKAVRVIVIVIERNPFFPPISEDKSKQIVIVFELALYSRSREGYILKGTWSAFGSVIAGREICFSTVCV